jgi:DNA-directed RNA polymerase II subunit RPB1
MGEFVPPGADAQEFFFHAMAGCEDLIDTAVKTAEAGYSTITGRRALPCATMEQYGTDLV